MSPPRRRVHNPGTQNTAAGSNTVSNVQYGGSSAETLATISLTDDHGEYEVEVEVTIYCTAFMLPWNSLPYERGGIMVCISDIAWPANPMDSFGTEFPETYYEATDDPCFLDFTGLTTGAIAGFHSHPKFNSNTQLNAGESCHGEGPYSYSSTEITQVNLFNKSFTGAPLFTSQGGDFNWPLDTGTPNYLLLPDADEIKILDTDRDTDMVYPL